MAKIEVQVSLPEVALQSAMAEVAGLIEAARSAKETQARRDAAVAVAFALAGIRSDSKDIGVRHDYP